MVYVLSKNNKPLMPCSNAIARLLLKTNKAKVKRKTPFTIKMLVETTEYTQPLTLGIDTDSDKIASAVVDNNNNIIYISEIEVKNDITKKMAARPKYKKNRRKRKNIIKSDRFSPTMTSKIETHKKEIKYVSSILPITKVIIETENFDPHALKNPDVLKNK